MSTPFTLNDDPVMLAGQFYTSLSYLKDLYERLESCGHVDVVPPSLRDALKEVKPPVSRDFRLTSADGLFTS